MKSFEIKMTKRLAEKLLRRARTLFVCKDGKCYETIAETKNSESLIEKWQVIQVFYNGGYWRIAE